MSTPRLPNQKTQYKKLNERLSKYMASVLSIYESLNKEAAKIALSTDYDGTEEFNFFLSVLFPDEQLYIMD